MKYLRNSVAEAHKSCGTALRDLASLDPLRITPHPSHGTKRMTYRLNNKAHNPKKCLYLPDQSKRRPLKGVLMINR